MMVVDCGAWVRGCSVGKNDNSTISITNAGAKRSYFFKMYKIVHFGKMYNFVHLENVSIFFTDSYVGVSHHREMNNFVHIGEMAMAVKTYMSFVTQSLARLFLAATLSIISY